ncbi:MAG: amidohydrolase family protein [Clostridia bacterium]|nr:amidohydrolase family protein [Clostridia bacterium]
MKDLIPAIDIHTHYNHGSPYDTKEHAVYRCDIKSLKEEYDHISIVAGGYSSFASVISDLDIAAENDHLLGLARENPWIFQWVVVDPRKKETLLQAEKLLGLPKTLGIKIHPGYHGYRIDDYAHEIFSFAAEREATVLMHPDNIPAMPAYADAYPKMRLIIAHLGGVEHVDAVANARHQNIFVDTSGGASTNNYVIEYAVSRIGSEHILFGTDTYSTAFQRGRIEFARISDRDRENILYGNAKRLFADNFADF